MELVLYFDTSNVNLKDVVQLNDEQINYSSCNNNLINTISNNKFTEEELKFEDLEKIHRTKMISLLKKIQKQLCKERQRVR